MSLGYITRVNHVEGRKDFRGEGFELRTDGWGVIRAANGLFISTDKRNQADQHQKDISEALKLLTEAVKSHSSMLEQAAKQKALKEEADEGKEAQNKQMENIKGSGEKHGEIALPEMLFSSPAGFAWTTPGHGHAFTGGQYSLTAGGNVSTVTSQSFAVGAARQVSLYANDAGMKMFAAAGKVQIQAQSDNVEISADQLINIVSAHDQIKISAPKEILLTAGGSYIKINSSGIESGTAGKFTAYAASHSLVGPKSLPAQAATFMKASKLVNPVCEVCEKIKKATQAPDNNSTATPGINPNGTGAFGKALGAAGAAGNLPGMAGAVGNAVSSVLGAIGTVAGAASGLAGAAGAVSGVAGAASNLAGLTGAGNVAGIAGTVAGLAGAAVGGTERLCGMAPIVTGTVSGSLPELNNSRKIVL